jgi:hypothetical protein
MDTQEILVLYDQLCLTVDDPGIQREVLPHLVRFMDPPPGNGFILHTRLDTGNVEAAIQEQIDYFDALGRSFEWKVLDLDTPADLKERLAAHGFQIEDAEAVMVLDLQEAPAALLKPVTADVRRLTERVQLEDVVQIKEQVWGNDHDDGVGDRLYAHLAIPGYLSVYAAYVQDEPASAGWIYFHGPSQFADLWGGSTVAAYRKQGLYTAVLAVRVQEAIRRGYRFLAIDASPMSRPIVASHGFRFLTYAHACVWNGK